MMPWAAGPPADTPRFPFNDKCMVPSLCGEFKERRGNGSARQWPGADRLAKDFHGSIQRMVPSARWPVGLSFYDEPSAHFGSASRKPESHLE
jgi:hypothetical protein